MITSTRQHLQRATRIQFLARFDYKALRLVLVNHCTANKMQVLELIKIVLVQIII